MANFTKFLQLLKKDPVADATDTFNIQTMLNENWDKIDEFCQIHQAKMASGSYVGTYTSSDPTSIEVALTFNFPVKVLFVWQKMPQGSSNYWSSIILPECPGPSVSISEGRSINDLNITVSKNTITINGGGGTNVCNLAGIEYGYAAFG